MKWGATAFLILFGAFILLLIFNPNLSCFGKRVRSPFYPLSRRRRARSAEPKKVQTTDYGFRPAEDAPGSGASPAPSASAGAVAPKAPPSAPTPAETKAQKKARDYGFKLD